jgi:hypothetical protein
MVDEPRDARVAGAPGWASEGRAVPGFRSAVKVLAAHGLAPGDDGYDPAALRSLATARGWRVEVEVAGGPHGRGRARAAVWRPRRGGRGRAPATVVRRAAASEAAALALALAAALAQEAW